jgi:transposase
MPRKPRPIIVSKKLRDELVTISKSRVSQAWLVQRANIVLACINEEPIQEISDRYGLSQSTVIRWKNRFLEKGLDGLRDATRSGRPTRYDSEFKSLVLEKLSEIPPDGYGQWTGALLAKELDASPDAVWRFLREQRINLARKRTWCVSTDPEFVRKAADVVGLYLDPPENAVVMAIDEKPNIQALGYETGYVCTSDKKIVQACESRYVRNGTLNLFAALEVATGVVHGKATASTEKNRVGFLKFMDDVLGELPDDLDYHVIMDNHSIHKNCGFWLEKHPNVTFHYTPTNASWLNMVEIWFGILSRSSLKNKSASTPDQLAKHIEAFIMSYNKDCKPFQWRKRVVKGSQLQNSIKNLE